jgi:hypothetical protein
VTRTIHVCMNARGLVRHLRSLRKNARTGLQDDEGRPLSREAAIDAVIDEIAKGHETLPMGGCANPCPRAHLGCTGFDYGENGGCPGYETPEKQE